MRQAERSLSAPLFVFPFPPASLLHVYALSVQFKVFMNAGSHAVTHRLLTVQPCVRPKSACWGLAAGQWRRQLAGQFDLRWLEAAKVNSSARCATSSVTATILVGCADECCHHLHRGRTVAVLASPSKVKRQSRDLRLLLWLNVWLLESSGLMVLRLFGDTHWYYFQQTSWTLKFPGWGHLLPATV